MGRKDWMNWEEYSASDVWKCSPSPTGAHHWVQIQESEELRKGGYFQCKWCGDVRKFPIYWSQIDPGRKGYTEED